MFDKEEALEQLNTILTLIEELRPIPGAELLSRKKVQMMAAIAGDADLERFAIMATSRTLFWQTPNGEIIEQQVSLKELPAA